MMHAFAWMALVLGGCAGGQVMRGAADPSTDLRKREAAPLRAGVARADITPPPGPSTFGHGPDARVAQGYWTRLYCRVFVLETHPADRVVLVPCDLHSISMLLHRDVAERVKSIVPASRLLITATHTHAGPAHYFESSAYSGFTSSRRPGFDPQMVDFLGARIADAIRSAHAALRPATARWMHAEAWKLTRNRSIRSWRANPPGLAPSPPAGLPLTEEEAAIDPALHVLQLESLDAAGARQLPMGWIVLFAMHPTVVGAKNRLFGADAFGVASRVLEAELRRTWQHRCESKGFADCAETPDPLVGIVNTNVGDVAPQWTTGDTEEAVVVGRMLAERAWATHPRDDARGDPPFRASIVVDSRYLESRLPGAPFPAAGDPRSLCPEAELGAGSRHGGSDHPTSLDVLIGGGSSLDTGRDDCQRPKKRMLGFLQMVMIGHSAFPAYAALALARIDDTWLAFVPAEMTVQAGASLRRRMLAALRTEDGRPAHAAVAGLANGYLQYIATRREYDMQEYEGAVTLYGPATAEYVEERFVLLARSMAGEPIALRDGEPRVGEAVSWPYDPPPTRARFPKPEDTVAPAGSLRRQRGLCTLPGLPPAAICFWWSDAAPARVPMHEGRWLALLDAATGSTFRSCNAWAPLASGWESTCDPGAAIDDRGLDFQTRVRAKKGEVFIWSSLLQPTLQEWNSIASRVRLQVPQGGAIAPVESAPFSRDHLPDLCPDDVVRFCTGDTDVEP